MTSPHAGSQNTPCSSPVNGRGSDARSINRFKLAVATPNTQTGDNQALALPGCRCGHHRRAPLRHDGGRMTDQTTPEKCAYVISGICHPLPMIVTAFVTLCISALH